MATAGVARENQAKTLREPTVHKWTVDDYMRLAEAGFLGEEPHVELIDGEVMDKVSPQARPHSISPLAAPEVAITVRDILP